MRELNLLPPHRRRSLRHQATLLSLTHFFDSLLIGLGILTVAGIAGWSLLWFVATTSSSGSAEELVQVIKEYQVLRDEIAQQNLFLEEIQTTSTRRLVWSNWLQDFFEAVSPGIDIAQLDGRVEAAEGGKERVITSIQGQASSSRNLDSFTRALRALPRVANIDAPLSNLLNPEAFALNIIFHDNGQTEK